MKTRSSSVGILNFQKQLSQNKINHHKKEFIPYLSERKLGKLIKDEDIMPRKMGIMDINHLNFKDIYKKQSILAAAKYSRLARNPQQEDLTSNNGWKIRKLGTQSSDKNCKGIMRDCCSHHEKKRIKPDIKYEKIDQQVYRKINEAKPSFNNEEVQTLFKHYAQICQLNQNIRREQLVRKKKY